MSDWVRSVFGLDALRGGKAAAAEPPRLRKTIEQYAADATVAARASALPADVRTLIENFLNDHDDHASASVDEYPSIGRIRVVCSCNASLDLETRSRPIPAPPLEELSRATSTSPIADSMLLSTWRLGSRQQVQKPPKPKLPVRQTDLRRRARPVGDEEL